MQRFSSFLLSFALLLLLCSSSLAVPYGGSKFDQRVTDLLANLTVREKIGQMTQIGIQYILIPGTNTLNRPLVTQLARQKFIGSFLQAPSSTSGRNLNVTEWINLITEIQQIFISEGSKIPMIYGIDSVHGAVFVHGATFFPQQINGGASFNRELVKQMGAITGKDSRVVGMPWVFAPILDLATEPRWARVYETFGEDPYVVGELGSSLIKGMQGEPINLKDPTKAAACMKHFIGYGEPRTGKDRNPTWIPDRFLYEYFVPPFQAAINAGVATTMESYNDVNGEPVCGSEKYLKKLLREEMGFKGMLVTDWAEIRDLTRFHKIAETEKDATRISIGRTSIDMSMVAIQPTFFDYLVELVEEGVISEARVDESAGRILQLKNDLGVFDNPLPDPNSPLLATIGSKEDRQYALELARESVTLLENRNQILPLSISKYSKILVTGPSGNSIAKQCGGWTVNWQGAPSDEFFAFGSTIFSSVRDIATQSEVVYKQGCDIEGNFEPNELEETVAEALKSDVVIVAIGERTYAERFGDIDDLTLPFGQLQLVDALTATGVPVIIVLIEGRPRVLNGVTEKAAAVLDAYLPCSEGGQAIAEILFGFVNPSGKLPLSYPKTTGTSPLQYYHKVTEESNFLWPFGHGLSYSTIVYSNLIVSKETISPTEVLDISVDVTNQGPFVAKETVLLFVSDLFREITPEVKRLRRFEKVLLGVGQTQTVRFQLSVEDLSFIGIALQRVYEPGEFVVEVSSLTKSFRLL